MHQDTNKNQHNTHEPVLLAEVLDYLKPEKGDRYLDLTAGYGGHATAILQATAGTATLVDRDENAVHELKRLFPKAALKHQDFLSASQTLAEAGEQFDIILADLGVSSPHLNEADRGFAINQDGPLDMRMDNRQELTADTIVNTYSDAELADILWRYGEEPKARQIARLIVGNRPLHSTKTLAAVASRAWPGKSRVHPATRTFQALRIAVNDELNLLEHEIVSCTDHQIRYHAICCGRDGGVRSERDLNGVSVATGQIAGATSSNA